MKAKKLLSDFQGGVSESPPLDFVKKGGGQNSKGGGQKI